MVKIIDGFSHDIDIDDALNLAQIGSAIAQSPKINPQALHLNTARSPEAVSSQNVRPPMATQDNNPNRNNRVLPSQSPDPRTPRPKNRS